MDPTSGASDYLASVSDALQSQIAGKISGTLHNWHLPINRLPIEIISELLEWHINAAESDRTSAIMDLSLVCRLWRDMVLHCPRLWTVLHSRDPPLFLWACVQRSQGLPLTIFTTDLSKDILELDELVQTCANRIRSIDYFGPDTRLLRPYIATVTSLAVEYIPDKDAIVQVPINHMKVLAITEGPPLHSLALRYLEITGCEWDRMKNLKTLNLENFTIGCEPYSFISNLIDAISASTGLQELLLKPDVSQQIPPGKSNDEDHSMMPVIRLPMLRSLKLFGRVSPYLSNLRRRLFAPNCRKITICERHMDDLIWEWLSRTIGQSARDISKVKITVQAARTPFTFHLLNNELAEWSIGTELTTNLDNALPHLLKLGQFLKEVEYSGPINLHLNSLANTETFHVNLPISILQEIGKVEKIRTYGCVDISSLLRTLGTPLPGTSGWPCPNLKEISISHHAPRSFAEVIGPNHPRWDMKSPGRDYERTVFICKTPGAGGS